MFFFFIFNFFKLDGIFIFFDKVLMFLIIILLVFLVEIFCILIFIVFVMLINLWGIIFKLYVKICGNNIVLYILCGKL